MKSLVTTKKVYDDLARHYSDFLEERLPQYNLTRFSSFILRSRVDAINQEVKKRLKGGKEPKKKAMRLSILDVGCGGGRDVAYLRDEGFEVTGIDLSENIIKEARRRVKGAVFEVMDLRKLTFTEDSFDGIWCCGPLCHIPRKEIEGVIRGFWRVMKPGGVLFMTTLEGQGEGMMARKELQGKEVFCALYSQQELEEALNSAGFEMMASLIEQPDERYVTIFSRKPQDQPGPHFKMS